MFTYKPLVNRYNGAMPYKLCGGVALIAIDIAWLMAQFWWK